MITAAVIAEYNPFHNGHAYQLKKIREITSCDNIVVIMSGDFVQRGGPACVDKYHRCQAALMGGADLIIELPSYGAMSSSEYFAESAVAILERLGCIDFLCFGTETSDLSVPQKAAALFINEPEAYREHLRTYLKDGMPYPKARSLSASEYLHDPMIENILAMPNNILAVEYLKALGKFKSKIRPVAIPRTGDGYHSAVPSTSMASATAIRNMIHKSISIIDNQTSEEDFLELRKSLRTYMPVDCADFLIHVLASEGMSSASDYMPLYLSELCRDLALNDVADLTSQMRSRIINHVPLTMDIDELARQLSGKSMTTARLRRVIFSIILGHRQTVLSDWKDRNYKTHCQLLGFKKDASALLGQIKLSMGDDLLLNAAELYETYDSEDEIFRQSIHDSMLYRHLISAKYGIPKKHILSQPMIIL